MDHEGQCKSHTTQNARIGLPEERTGHDYEEKKEDELQLVLAEREVLERRVRVWC